MKEEIEKMKALVTQITDITFGIINNTAYTKEERLVGLCITNQVRKLQNQIFEAQINE